MLPVGHRSEVFRSDSGALVIDDTFNSNPSGAERALKVLNSQKEGRRILVTPGFFELGNQQAIRTREFIESALGADIEVVFVGYTNRRAIASLVSRSDNRLRLATNRTRAKRALKALGPLDAVLWENDLPVHLP